MLISFENVAYRYGSEITIFSKKMRFAFGTKEEMGKVRTIDIRDAKSIYEPIEYDCLVGIEKDGMLMATEEATYNFAKGISSLSFCIEEPKESIEGTTEENTIEL